MHFCQYYSSELLNLVIKMRLPEDRFNRARVRWQSFVWIHQFSRYKMRPVIEHPLSVFYGGVGFKRETVFIR